MVTCGCSSRRAGLAYPHIHPAASRKETDTCRRPRGQDVAEDVAPAEPGRWLAHPPGRGDPCPSPPSASAHVEAVGGKAAGWGPWGQLRTLEGTADSVMKSMSSSGKVAPPGGLRGNWAF